MNPDSMEFAGRRSPPREHTEEDAEVRAQVVLPPRLLQLREVAIRAGTWMQDAIRDDPQDERAQIIRLHVVNGQVGAARQLWNEQSEALGEGIMPVPGDDEAAQHAFGNGLDSYYNWIIYADRELVKMPGLVYEAEGPRVAHLMQARAAELEALGHAPAADRMRVLQEADALARRNWVAYQAQQKHLEAYFGEPETQKQLRRHAAGRATRNLPAPPHARPFGAPQRQRVEKRELGPPERVQPRDKQGRFTDSDSKGKGEL